MADVLFFAEQRGGEFRRTAFEAATAARSLANDLGGRVHGVVCGDSVSSIAGGLTAYGADSIHTVEHAALALPGGRMVAEAVAAVAKEVGAGAVVIPTSALGKDAAPRVAALLDAGYVPDIVELAVTDGRPVGIKPMYSGKVRSSITFDADPAVVGIRPNAFTSVEASGAGEVQAFSFTPSDEAARVTVKAFKASEGGRVDLGEASRIVSGGRGVKGPENFPIIQALADAIGGAMGASRAAVDAGWIDHAHQVGQTGRTVSPDL